MTPRQLVLAAVTVALALAARRLQRRGELERDPLRDSVAAVSTGVVDGEVLLDEKLGLHIAFGRSEHFGGQVGPAQFSRPEAVVHQDRVYVPAIQPRLVAARVDLQPRSLLDPAAGQYVMADNPGHVGVPDEYESLARLPEYLLRLSHRVDVFPLERG